MAGLPCEVCQEETTVVPSAQIVEDAAGRTVYRRYRTCTNPDCELYLIRRDTLEVFAPLTPDAPFVRPYLHNLKKTRGILPRRTAPFPLELVPEEVRRAYEARVIPSIDERESKVVELACYLGSVTPADVCGRLSCRLETAQKLLCRLSDLGILVYSTAVSGYAPVPEDEIPPQIRLPEHLQRSAS